MHYIIGTTKLAFKKQPVRVGATSATRVNTKPPEFEYNKTYTLYNIRKVDDQWCYVFRDQTGKKVERLFDTATQADQWIAGLRGDKLPDYNEFYSKNNS